MAIYFNVIVPVKTFLKVAEKVMSKYDVKLYIEKASVIGNRKRFYYVTEGITERDFYDEDYRRFFFSTKELDLSGKERILEEGKLIYLDWYSFYDDTSSAIEGEGGRERKNDIECIRLRQLQKEPDPQIKGFYKSLQYELKRSENMKLDKRKGLSVYYVETPKKMWSYYDKQIPYTLTTKENK